MKRRLFLAICLILASGYLLDVSFKGMNLPRNDTYVAGILALSAWFIFVVPFVWKKLKGKPICWEGNNESSKTVSSSHSGNATNGLHNENRTG